VQCVESTSVTFFIPARKSDEQQIVMIERVKPIIATAGNIFKKLLGF
jgi:hypothetical protein